MARFRDFVELHMEPHRILPEDNERSLISDGISRFELDGPQARGVVAVAASHSGQLLASDVSRHMRNVIHQFAGKRGSISKRKFDKAVMILIAMVDGADHRAGGAGAAEAADREQRRQGAWSRVVPQAAVVPQDQTGKIARGGLSGTGGTGCRIISRQSVCCCDG